MASPEQAGVVVVGGGLAGGLLALELAAIGPPPWLVDGGPAGATALSYGLLPLTAIGPWLALQRRHGPLGLRLRLARFHGKPAGLGWLPLPVAQVEAATLLEALPRLLDAAGVRRLRGRVLAPLRQLARGWKLEVTPDSTDGVPPGPPVSLEAGQVVLAAGAACRSLWPALPSRLRTSWAGALELSQPPPWRMRWPAQVVLPWHFRRPELEQRAASLREPASVVDAGLVPTGAAWLAGQLTLVPPEPVAAPAPDPAWMEARLRRGLTGFGAVPAAVAGGYRQVPVAFCTDGRPLVGPVDGAAGLWVFTGFSGAFSQVPPLLRPLATALASAAAQAGAPPG
jgi:glycine/D-amino acid oxidase-like deaminating enzyme